MSSTTIKRQQLVDRNDFDRFDRQELLEKTKSRCAYCGTALKMGKNATLDHYVPLSKGGINQRLNIVPMCETCNKQKGGRIVSPNGYLKYLNETDRQTLEDYFQSYLKSFDYISRGNLLSCDMYVIYLYLGNKKLHAKNQKQLKQMKKMWSKPYLLERMLRSEQEEVTEFFIQYLKKHEMLADKDTAAKNVEFWTQFGAIYCIRDKATRDIRVMIPITMGKDTEGRHRLHINLFSMYGTDISAGLASEAPHFFAQTLMHEQDLDYLRVVQAMPVQDKANKYMHVDNTCCVQDGWVYSGTLYRQNAEVNPEATNEDAMPFYQKFHDIRKYMDAFFEQDGYGHLRHMGVELIEDYLDDIQKNNE